LINYLEEREFIEQKAFGILKRKYSDQSMLKKAKKRNKKKEKKKEKKNKQTDKKTKKSIADSSFHVNVLNISPVAIIYASY
jgi:uncharacterized membrane protein